MALFDNYSSRRRARRLFRRRDHECDPTIPPGGPVLVDEFPLAFEVEITLRLAGQGNDEPELRSGAHDLRLEAANTRMTRRACRTSASGMARSMPARATPISIRRPGTNS